MAGLSFVLMLKSLSHMRKHTKIYELVLLALLMAAPVSAANLMPPTFPPPPASYFPLLPLNGGPDAQAQFIPLATNHALEIDHPGLTQAVIVIHDFSRNASATLAMMTSLAGEASATTFIMAPQFLQDSDIMHYAGQLPDQGKMFARWPLDGWITGGDSLGQKGISSFTAIDILLMYLSDKKFFPDLNQVVLVGHGAGGDFVQRYAALGQAPDSLDQHNINVRFVVANPSSYLYFTTSRAKSNRQGFGPADAAQCNSYNSYPYGLDNLNPYGRLVGPHAIKLRFVTRPIVYLLGEQAAQGDQLPDNSCAALLEGMERVARGLNYNLYLKVIFGDAINRLQRFIVVPKVGYEPAPLLGSPCALATIFGNGECGLSQP
ncbi:MAG: hypothetical protein WAO98_09950 [Alphaproteobacteria bacterium]